MQISMYQERFLTQWLLDPNSSKYNVSLAYKLDKSVNLEYLKKACLKAINEDNFYMAIDKENTPYKENYSEEEFIEEIEYVESEEDIKEYLIKLVNTPFDLYNEPFFKYYFIKSKSNLYLILLSYHILTDGSTFRILKDRIKEFYKQLIDNKDIVKLNNEDYKNTIKQEQSLITKEKKEISKEYWLDFLKDYPLGVDFPTKVNNSSSLKSETVYFKFQGEEYLELKKSIRKSRTTLFTYLLAVYGIVLNKYSNQEKIIISYPIDSRPQNYPNVVGSFVNNSLIKVDLKKNLSFDQLLSSLNNQRKELKEHQWYLFDDIIQDLRKIKTDNLEENFFNVTMGESLFSTSSLNLKDINSEGLIDVSWSKESDFLLSLLFDVSDKDEIVLQLEYQCEKLDLPLVKNFLNHFRDILNIVATNPEILIKDISLLKQEEYQQLIYINNQTDKAYPQSTIHEQFQRQAQLTPNNIAIQYEDKELTYKELDKLSNQMARYIQRKYKEQTNSSITPDSLIALCLDRSLEMIISILGVLKAGGAYVPIDPNYPNDRIRYILEDTDTKIVLTQSHLEDKVNTLIKNNINTISVDKEEYKKEGNTPLTFISTPNNLAYVIYTSGTTGKPKGVMVEHTGVINLIENQIKEFKISSNEQILQSSNYIFDASIEQINIALLSGNTLHLITKELIEDNKSLCEYIDNHKITHVHFTPSYLESTENLNTNSLKRIVAGGEQCSKKLAETYKDKLINEYGPTETTITSLQYHISNSDSLVPIGKPLNNTKTYILDANLKPVPRGITGELYIAGAGLARGYLNKEELTKERFINNPFASKEDIANGYTRMYKTGDLVRVLEDNNIEYIGRSDFQVKIRGYRIELGEIESVISKYKDIKQAVVLAKEKNNSKYLVAYYTSTNEIKEEELINSISKELAEYMIPTAFVQVDEFKLTVNGKLDTKSLPEPELKSEEYIAPSDELEIKICKIFKEVLNVEQVGIKDDFFKLGGNSILAISLAHKLSKALSLEIKVADIFNYKNVSQLIEHGLAHDTIHIPKVEQEKYPLSFAQQRLYFIEQYEEGSNAYNIPISIKLDKNTDVEIFKKAIESVVNRHEILRTLIKEDKETNVYQEISKEQLLFNEHYYFSKEKLDNKLKEDVNRVFKLNEELPIYVGIYELKEEIYVLINIHHIAFDGWSTDIFFKEINEYYYHYKDNKKLNLANLSIGYKDFALWQRDYLQGEELNRQLTYWENKLSSVEPLGLRSDYQRPQKINYEGNSYQVKLDKRLSSNIIQLAKEKGVSLYTLLLSAFNILLSKYTNQEDIVIGSPTASRHYKQIEDVIGFFVNTLAIRNTLDNKENFYSFLDKVEQSVIEAQSHQDIPFEHLVDKLDIERDTSRHPIFDILFSFQNFGMQSSTKLYNTYNTESYKIAKFDLELFVNQDEEELLDLYFNYSTSLFKLSSIKSMTDRYVQILEQITTNPEISIKDISLLKQEEYQQLIYINNQTDKAYPQSTIHEQFQRQAQLTPNNIAIQYEDKELTYKELDKLSNQMARYIQRKYKEQTNSSITPDSLIALCLDRSLEMIISILGVLKAGGAYVPIDPNYPNDRIRYILEDTDTKIVLTQSHLEDKVNTLIKNNINTISVDKEEYKKEENTPLTSISTPNNLAYVIYTSGTTGKPKGVMCEHHGVINLVKSQVSRYNMNLQSLIYLGVSYAFDASVESIISTLLSGASLFISKEIDFKNPSLNKITHLIVSAPLLEILNLENLSNLKYLIYGGDKVSSSILSKFNDINLFIEYGVTESSVTSLFYKINDINYLPIGKPLNNTKTYILDKNLNPVAKGITGELYIAGAGLARGYLNKEELTKERFINNPFASKEDIANGYTRMYKTGDLVRVLEDNNIEYIGRSDFQVKIRGYRIELGEIESVISKYKDIKQAVVLAKEKNNSKYLVAYYTSTNEIKEEELINSISKELAEYMIPTAFVQVDEFKLTVNGKLDTKSLPEPELKSEEYIAPSDELEIKICKIFKEVLNVEQVGIKDDFFKIGGDSILSIQLSSRFKKEGMECSIKDIFTCKTVEKLAKFLDANHSKVFITAEQELLEGEFELLSIQKWFTQKVKGEEFLNYNHWNQSFMIKVPPLDLKQLEISLAKLVDHHDILRTTFKKDMDKNGNINYTQIYNKNIKVPKINTLDISKYNEEELFSILTKWQSKFNIFNTSNEALFTLGYLYNSNDKSARIFFSAHHLIIDAVSWRIIVEDLQTLYNNGKLLDKTSSYRQWISSVKSYVNDNKDELGYWKDIIKSSSEYEYNNTIKSNSKNISFSKTLTNDLLQKSNQAYNTGINDILLCALSYALNSITNKTSNLITLEGHGREDIDSSIDTTRTLGWFTTMYPLILEKKDSISSSLKTIKESLYSIPNKGIGYGALKYYLDDPILSNHSLAPIGFNYLGVLDTTKNDISSWHLVNESTGISMNIKNKNSNILDINGMVMDGKLSFNIDSKLSTEKLELFSNSFKDSLEKIVSHCISQIDKNILSYTPSDFKLPISIELFDKLYTNKIESIYKANSLQQGFIYHYLAHPNDDAYRVQQLIDYNNPINIESYKKAWELLIETYPILRTSFNWEEKPLQVIHKKGDLAFTFYDLSNSINIDKDIKTIQEEDRLIPFDLSKPSLFRVCLLKHNEFKYTLLKSEHHSIGDGWSGPVLLNKLHEYYENIENKKKINVIEDKAYQEAQKYYENNYKQSDNYWKKHIQKIDHPNDLNPFLSLSMDLDNIRSVDRSVDMDIKLDLDPLKKVVSSYGITINSMVQFAWHKLIHTYTRDEQTIVGTTLSGRAIPVDNIDQSVGLYINTLPLILNWEDKTILKQLNSINESINDLNSYSAQNLASLQSNGERLFHSLFIYENYPMPKKSEEKSLIDISFREAHEKTNYPISVLAYDLQDQLTVVLRYDNSLIEENKAKKILNQLSKIIKQIPQKLNDSHKDISLLNQEEYQQLIHLNNQTDKEYLPSTIHQLFEEQAKKTPDNIAIQYEDKTLTYKELDKLSNQMARYIQIKTKMQADTLIALCLDRSLEMIISIFGVLKAGGAYVPIDPSYPEDRIKYILEDTNSKLILSQSHLKDKINTFIEDDISLVFVDKNEYKDQDNLEIDFISSPKDLAYVIYTSGTTGKPKGVMIEQKSFVDFIANFPIEKDQINLLSFTTYTFDIFGLEYAFPLIHGGKIVLSRMDRINIDLNIHNDINVIQQTPSVLSLVLNQLDDVSLKGVTCLVGGEPLSKDVLVKLQKIFRSVLNVYGPSETVIWSSAYDCTNSNISNIIGKPLINEKLYILNNNLQPVPRGITGELYIAGAGLARGYLNKEELTKERFINNPFASKEDIANGYTRMYKTGDLVRVLEDNNIEYIGRSDFQVKIRGYRIELGEIESVISKYKDIKQAVVLAKEKNNSKYLVAYYTSTNEIKEEELINSISKELAEYMIPTAFVQVDEFKLTVNGKLDTKSLPEPELKSEEYIAPSDELEIKICKIFKEVLMLEQVGIKDDFFKLGGDSISSIGLIHRINERLMVNINISSLMENKTVEKLAIYVASNIAENEAMEFGEI